jgi:hypothetical protein
MPATMKYSEEGIYDHQPMRGEVRFPKRAAHPFLAANVALTTPGLSGCRRRVTQNRRPRPPQTWQRPPCEQEAHGPCVAALTTIHRIPLLTCIPGLNLSDDPIVHESEMRRSFLQGRVLEDDDRGKACLKYGPDAPFRFTSCSAALCVATVPPSAVSPQIDVIPTPLPHSCATCPGFEEHYWRKVCKWCRCKRIEYVVVDVCLPPSSAPTVVPHIPLSQ